MMHSRLSRQAIAWRQAEAAQREVAIPLSLDLPPPAGGSPDLRDAETGPAEADFGAEAGGWTMPSAAEIDDDFY